MQFASLTRLSSRVELELTSATEKSREEAILPVFITCDPARDSPQAIKTYLKGRILYTRIDRAGLIACADFHPSLVGLTGSYEDIKATCKA